MVIDGGIFCLYCFCKVVKGVMIYVLLEVKDLFILLENEFYFFDFVVKVNVFIVRFLSLSDKLILVLFVLEVCLE